MSREWKPGDVALVRNQCNVWNVAICTLRADRLGWWWRYGVADDWSPITADALPLVVIDPEDHEQVERLLKLMGDHISTADALREFAKPKPPKPPEPMALGAVVEDDKGVRWVRCGSSSFHANWRAVGSEPWVEYADLPAVRVLSEGVTE